MDGILTKIDPPEAQLIRAEMENILASVSFVRATRLQRLLRFLVERSIKNPQDPPKEYEIGIEAFDRDPNFDPQTDAIVRVQAARLRAKLRDYSLADGRNSPIVIELPKGSYDLVFRRPAPVMEDIPAAPEPERSAPAIVTMPGRRWPWAAFTLAAVVVGSVLAVLTWRISTQSPNQPGSKIVPFADYSGDQDDAAFSLDGKEIAFTLRKEGADHSDIYVKLIGAGTPLRLTFDQANKSSPKWSPDGQFVAFVRRIEEGQTAVCVVPALGGSERKLAQMSAEGMSLSWSPDGRYIAFVDHVAGGQWGIWLVSPDTGERRALTNPDSKETDTYPAFSPDSRSVAFVRGNRSPNVTDLYVISALGGKPKRITNDKRMIRGVAWSPGGGDLIFSSNQAGPYRLWRVPAGGGVEPQPVSEAGYNAINPAISPKTGYLAYTEWYTNVNIWQIKEGAAGDWSAPSKLIGSSRTQNSPEFSPDGSRIVFASDRSGFDEIWRCDADGSNAVQLTHFEGPPTGTPHWSPDGKWIVFDSRPNQKADVFVIAAEGGPVRRVNTDASQSGVPNWSRDGKSIYVSSDRAGAWQLWRIPWEGGAAVQLTKHGAFDSAESPDGRFVYYTKGRKPGMWKMPVQGGDEIAVPELSLAGEWRYWRVTGKGYYYATRGDRQFPTLVFFSFALHRPVVIGYLQRGTDGNGLGLAVSPDDRTLLYAQLDQSVRDIMLVNHFH